MSPSLPAYSCVRCGCAVYKPRSACRDCNAVDRKIVVRMTA